MNDPNNQFKKCPIGNIFCQLSNMNRKLGPNLPGLWAWVRWKMSTKTKDCTYSHMQSNLTEEERTEGCCPQILDAWNAVSDMEKNGLICLKNYFENKVCFQVFKFYVFLLFHFFLQVSLWTNIAILPHI